MGKLIYFFEKACGISGYILGVNPFNQPGVEHTKEICLLYLKNPADEDETKAIKQKLSTLYKG